jgi:hypothetical protein
MSFWPNSVSSDLGSDHFLNIDYFASLTFRLDASATLALRGYPGDLNWVDYEKRTIHTRASAVDGYYEGPAESRHCSIIAF